MTDKELIELVLIRATRGFLGSNFWYRETGKHRDIVRIDVGFVMFSPTKVTLCKNADLAGKWEFSLSMSNTSIETVVDTVLYSTGYRVNPEEHPCFVKFPIQSRPTIRRFQ